MLGYLAILSSNCLGLSHTQTGSKDVECSEWNQQRRGWGIQPVWNVNYESILNVNGTVSSDHQPVLWPCEHLQLFRTMHVAKLWLYMMQLHAGGCKRINKHLLQTQTPAVNLHSSAPLHWSLRLTIALELSTVEMSIKLETSWYTLLPN